MPHLRELMIVCRKLATLPAVMALALSGTAFAKQGNSIDPFASVEMRAIQSDLDFDEGEDVDSSGYGLNGEIGAEWRASRDTSVQASVEAGFFDYKDSTRGTRETYGGAIELTQRLSDQWELRLRGRRVENISVLEASSADQTSADARLQWENGNDRIRMGVQYREREYDLIANPNGDGFSVDAQYNRRLGAYHWVRLDLRHDEMDSQDDPRRSYKRNVARIKYSLPVASQLRLRPSVEYRKWKYDARIAQGDPQGDPRKDSYVAPAVDLAWGRDSSGPYAIASIEYRLRKSNDVRYDSDAIRAGIRIGYRF